MNLKMNQVSMKQSDLLIVPVFSDECISCANVNAAVLEPALGNGKFKADSGEVFVTPFIWESELKTAVLIGLGKKSELTTEKVRVVFGKAWKKAVELKANAVLIDLLTGFGSTFDAIFTGMVEGIGLAQYKFDRYKTDKKETPEVQVSFSIDDETAAKHAELHLETAMLLVDATCLARDLVNEPSNVIYPETLAQEAIEAGKNYGFEVEVKDESDIDELHMDAFLAVAQGSENAPRLIIMRHFGNPDQPQEILGYVGKGLTYDSGGYAIKPAEGMVTMKSDMGGAASVIGAMSAIAKANLKINVVAVIAACENMISGGAYKNGDIIGSMAGKTIEILNTDAEGRLTLADAVHYILTEEKATRVVDIATLTGAALVALGQTIAPVVSNNDEFCSALMMAAATAGEKYWRMPSDEDYKKMIKSDIADLKNIGGRFGGTITAGLFIGEFVQDKPWLHLDIAGTSWQDADKEYCPKGATGFGVRTLYHLADTLSK